MKLAKHPPLAGFLSPSGGAAVKYKKIGAPVAPHSFKNFRSVMRIPNMCFVLKLDNGKVVSIANKQIHRQTDRITEPSSTVLVYRCKQTF